MYDLISRQDAKVSVTRYFEVHIRNQKSRRLKEHAEEICKDICFGIDAWPSAQPTLYGYKIEHLALIAKVMEKEGVSPEKAVETFENIVGIVQMIADEQKEIIRKAAEQWT